MQLTIAFSSPKNNLMLFGRGIELIEKRPFSHVLVIFKDEITDMDMVFHANHRGVNIMTLDNFKVDNDIVKQYDLNVEDSHYKEFHIFKNQMLGVSYSWTEIFCILIQKLFHIKIPYNDGKTSVICSELAAMVCEVISMSIPDGAEEGITPSGLNELLSNNIL